MNKNIFNQFHIITNKLLVKPELVFLILSLFFGLFFIFHLAPLSGTDEFTHFPRVYQISQGVFWEKKLPNSQFGGMLPSNLNSMINNYRNLTRISPGSSYVQTEKNLNSYYRSINNVGNTKQQAIFTSVILYPPWAYISSLIGILIAKILKVPLIWYVYLGRITSLLIWILLTYLAIRIIPSAKWFMVALALLPTSLSQAATVSTDGLLNGISWLLIALILAISAKSIKYNWWLLGLVSFLSLYVALIKDGYFLIGLSVLAIPNSSFIKKTAGNIWRYVTAFIVIIASVLFTLRTVHADYGVVLTPTIGMYFNSHIQIQFILNHPLLFGLRVLIQPFTKTFDTTYLGIVGIITNRLIYLSILVIVTLFVGLYIGLKQSGRIERLAVNKFRLISVLLIIFIATYGLLAAAFYIGNTTVGAVYVNGFYGRYFLPMLPLLLVLPLTLRRRNELKQRSYVISISTISVIGLVALIMSLR